MSESLTLFVVFAGILQFVDCNQCTTSYLGSTSVRGVEVHSTGTAIQLHQQFPCDGIIEGWHVHSPLASSGTLSLQVFEPSVITSCSFTLRGETVVTELDAGVNYIQLNPAEYIEFVSGDYIGVSVADGLTLSYAYNDSSALGNLLCVDGILLVGIREYDVQAVFSAVGNVLSEEIGFVGCNEHTNNDRVLDTSGALYEWSTINPETCKLLCAKDRKVYTSIQDGDQCFCSNIVTPAPTIAQCDGFDPPIIIGTRISPTNLNVINLLWVTPDLLLSHTHDSIVKIANSSIIDGALDGLEAYVRYKLVTNVETSKSALKAVNYAYRLGLPDESFFELGFQQNEFEFYYTETGAFEIQTKASDFFGSVIFAVSKVVVAHPLAAVSLHCPYFAIAGESSQCELTVYGGKSPFTSSSLDLGDGTIIDIATLITESSSFIAGMPFPLENSGQSTEELYVYLQAAYPFPQNASLIGIEVDCSTAGSFIIQIYRPCCRDPDKEYCFETNSCIDPTVESCISTGGSHKMKCPVGSKYGLGKQACIDVITKEAKPSDLLWFDATSVHNCYSFHNIHQEITLTCMSAGVQLLLLSAADQKAFREEVRAGDVFAYYHNSVGAVKKGLVPGATTIKFHDSEAGFISRLANEFIIPENYTLEPEGTVYMFRAHYVKPTKIIIDHTFLAGADGTAQNSLTASVVDNWGTSLPDTTVIHVRTSISSLTFDVPFSVTSGETFTITIPSHPGDGPTCSYYMELPEQPEQFLGNGVTTTFADAGIKNITFRAVNDVSEVTVSSSVIVQDPVSGLTIWPTTPTILTEISVIKISVNTGSFLRYTVDWGDGNTDFLSNTDTIEILHMVWSSDDGYEVIETTGINALSSECYLVYHITETYVTFFSAMPLPISSIELQSIDWSITEGSYEGELTEIDEDGGHSFLFMDYLVKVYGTVTKLVFHSMTTEETKLQLQIFMLQKIRQNTVQYKLKSQTGDLVINSPGKYEFDVSTNVAPGDVIGYTSLDKGKPTRITYEEDISSSVLISTSDDTLEMVGNTAWFVKAGLHRRYSLEIVISSVPNSVTSRVGSSLVPTENKIVAEWDSTAPDPEPIDGVFTHEIAPTTGFLSLRMQGAFCIGDIRAVIKELPLSYELNHTYENFDKFEISVLAENFVSFADSTAFQDVQIQLTNFQMHEVDPQTYGDEICVYTSLQTGSHGVFEALFNENIPPASSSMSTDDQDNLWGYTCMQEGQQYFDRGFYKFEMCCENLVTARQCKSITIQIEKALEGLALVINPGVCSVYEYIDVCSTYDYPEFSLTAAEGTNYNVTFDWNDGSMEFYHYMFPTDVGLSPYPHNFEDALNSYSVHVFIENAVSMWEGTLPVRVQQPVEERYTNFVSNSPVEILRNDYGHAEFYVTWNGPKDPTEVEYFVEDFGDGANETGFLDISTSNPLNTLYHDYKPYGTYPYIIYIFNLISSISFTMDVIVEEPVQDVVLLPDNIYIRVGQNEDLKLTMEWGSRVNFKWNYDDDMFPQMYFKERTREETWTKKWVTDGWKYVTVEMDNFIGSVVASCVIMVEFPINDMFMLFRPVNKSVLLPVVPKNPDDLSEGYDTTTAFAEILLLRFLATPQPTNVTFVIDWNDKHSSAADNIQEDVLLPENPEPVQMPLWDNYVADQYRLHNIAKHYFTVKGSYTPCIYMKNQVSEGQLCTTITVYVEIVEDAINPYFDRELGNGTVITYPTGFGPGNNYFPVEQKVLFFGTKTKGSITEFLWTYGDNTSVESTEGIKQAGHFYDKWGSYKVVLNTSSPVFRESASKWLFMETSVCDIELSSNSPWPVNWTHTFWLYTGCIATDACYFIDFKDTNPLTDPGRFVFFGNQSQCATHELYKQEYYEASWCKTHQELEAMRDAGEIQNCTFYFTFIDVASHYIELEVWNWVSSFTQVYHAKATRGPCFYPVVDLEKQNPCGFDNCETKTVGDKQVEARKFQKGLNINLRPFIKVNCSSTRRALYNWTLYDVDEEAGLVRLITPDRLPSDIVMFGPSLSILIIPPRTLNYSLYMVHLNVSMEDENGMWTKSSMYLSIVKSKLQIDLEKYRMVPNRNPFVFDLFKHCYDPDVLSSNKTNMNCRLACKKACEKWPCPQGGQNFEGHGCVDTYDNTECLKDIDRRVESGDLDESYADTHRVHKGCFNTNVLNVPSYILGGLDDVEEMTVPWFEKKVTHENASGVPIYEFQAIEMLSDTKYDILVCCEKTDEDGSKRKECLEIQLTVNKGSSPIVKLICKSNCKKVVNPLTGSVYQMVSPSSRVALQAYVQDAISTKNYIFNWQLTLIPLGTLDTSTIDPIDPAEWSNMTQTGLQEEGICISKGEFTLEQGGNTYILEANVWHRYPTSKEEESAGIASYTFVINRPPEAGTCEVTPDVGVFLEDKFNITCIGFTDPDQTLAGVDPTIIYRYSVRCDPEDDFTEFLEKPVMKEGDDPIFEESDLSDLMPGLPEYNFTCTLRIRAMDVYGAMIEMYLNITIDLPSEIPCGFMMEFIRNNTDMGVISGSRFPYLAKMANLFELALNVRSFSQVLNANPLDVCYERASCPPGITSARLTGVEDKLEYEYKNCAERGGCDHLGACCLFPEIDDNDDDDDDNDDGGGDDDDDDDSDDDTTGLPVCVCSSEAFTGDYCEKRNHSMWYLLTAEERIERIQFREEMAEALSTVIATTVTDLEKMASAYVAVTQVEEEVSLTVIGHQIKALNNSLQSILSDDNQDADRIEEAAKQVLDSIANIKTFVGYRAKLIREEMEANNGTLPESSEFASSDGSEEEESMEGAIAEPAAITGLSSYEAFTDADIDVCEEILRMASYLEEKLAEIVLNIKVTGEFNTVLSGRKQVSIMSKMLLKQFGSAVMNGGGGCSTTMPEDSAAIFGEVASSAEIKVDCVTNNAYTATNTSVDISSKIVSVTMKNDTGSTMVVKDLQGNDCFKIAVPLKGLEDPEGKPMYNTTVDFNGPFIIHRVVIPPKKSLMIKVTVNERAYMNCSNSTEEENMEDCPMDSRYEAVENKTLANESLFLVAVNLDETFMKGKHEASYTFCSPRNVSDEAGYDLDNNRTILQTRGDPSVHIITAYELNTTEEVVAYVGVCSIPLGCTCDDFEGTKISGCPFQDFIPVNYTLEIATSSCEYYDEEDGEWKTEGVRVHAFETTMETVICVACHLTAFASGFTIPMNTIDFSNSAWANLAENPVAFAFGISCIGLYFILLIWARKKDKLDTLVAGAIPLADNDPRDKYLYEMTVYTGSRRNSGSTAKVTLVLSGDRGETEPRFLDDRKRRILRRGAVDAFIMAVPASLGRLSHLRIWHDNSGKSPGWYFSRIQIVDVQTGDNFFFLADRWLAVEEEDGQIDVIIPVAGRTELTDFNHLFWSRTKRSLADDHIWFSVFSRPARSRFTRVQRLTCVLSLLFCTMVANIMFWKAETENVPVVVVTLGPVTVTVESLITGLLSSLIIFPVNVGLVLLFKLARERTPKMLRDAAKAQEKARKQKEKEEKQRKEAWAQNDYTRELHEEGEKLGHYELEMNQPTVGKLDGVTVYHTQQTRFKKKEPFSLPWWFIIIGYVISFFTVTVAFYFIVEFAGGFGTEKALEWLMSMFVSLFGSILLTQPIKVLVLAMLYALIIKKPDKAQYERDNRLEHDEEYIYEVFKEEDMKDPEKLKEFKKRRAPKFLPPDPESLADYRETRLKEVEMHGVIREIIVYIIFLYCLMMVAYGNSDPWAFQMKTNFINQFVVGSAANVPAGQDFAPYHLNTINTRERFWAWTHEVLLPTIFPSKWYNGDRWKFGINDANGFLVGPVRFRQLRVQPGSCTISNKLISIIEHCRDEYNWDEEDEEDYKEQWVPVNKSDPKDKPDPNWTYRGALDLMNSPYWGRIHWYWGGGYVVDMENSYSKMESKLQELFDKWWIDQRTRAVFVELVLYYANRNLFAVAELLFEFPATGGVIAFPRVDVIRLDPYHGGVAVAVLAAEIITALFFFYFTVTTLRKLYKERKEFFKVFWNVMDCIVIVLILVAIIIYVYRLVSGNTTTNQFRENPEEFINFTNMASWHETYSQLISFILFIACVKLLKLLEFNKRIASFGRTLRVAIKPLISFLVVFAGLFVPFTMIGNLVFGKVLPVYSSWGKTFEGLFVLMLDKKNFDKLETANRLFGPIFYFTFMTLCTIMLINLVLAVVIRSFAQVQAENKNSRNKYELIQFIMARMKRFLGLSTGYRRHEAKLRYVEAVDPVDEQVSEMKEKVDIMLDRLMEYMKAAKSEDKAAYRDVDLDEPLHIKRKIHVA